jgi:hypothetical protein
MIIFKIDEKARNKVSQFLLLNYSVWLKYNIIEVTMHFQIVTKASNTHQLRSNHSSLS